MKNCPLCGVSGRISYRRIARHPRQALGRNPKTPPLMAVIACPRCQYHNQLIEPLQEAHRG